MIKVLIFVCGVTWMNAALADDVRCHPDENQTALIWEEMEVHCLELLGDKAARQGDTLRLTIDDGSAKTFTDTKEGCEVVFDYGKCIRYRLMAYHERPQAFVVDAAFSECGRLMLVSRRTGKELKLSTAMPHYSPSGTQFVVVDNSEACERPHDIAIWSTDDDPGRLQWSYSTPKGYPYEQWRFLRWESEDRIRLSVSVTKPKAGSEVYNILAVRLAQGWQLRRMK